MKDDRDGKSRDSHLVVHGRSLILLLLLFNATHNLLILHTERERKRHPTHMQFSCILSLIRLSSSLFFSHSRACAAATTIDDDDARRIDLCHSLF